MYPHSRLTVTDTHQHDILVCYSKVTGILSGVELHTIVVAAWRMWRAKSVDIGLQLRYRLDVPLRTYMDTEALLLNLSYVLETAVRIMPAQTRATVCCTVSVSVKQRTHTCRHRHSHLGVGVQFLSQRHLYTSLYIYIFIDDLISNCQAKY